MNKKGAWTARGGMAIFCTFGGGLRAQKHLLPEITLEGFLLLILFLHTIILNFPLNYS